MLSIGQVYIQKMDHQVRLCADLSLNGRGITLWYGVDPSQEEYLCSDRSDAFVMALLPTAMRGGYDIQCITPISHRLKYQLEQFLIPTLSAAGSLYHTIQIHGPTDHRPVKSRNGAGLGFSGGVDCMYSLMTHGKESTYPVTHLCVFNVGAFDGPAAQTSFQNACINTAKFAQEYGLQIVALDSNIRDVLPERFLDICTFRIISGAMALQGLLSKYFLASGFDTGTFSINFRVVGTFDPLIIPCSQTESLSVYLSGSEVKRHEKLQAMLDWEPAQKWVHPCFHTGIGRNNCSRCHKCVRDMVTLYSFGRLEDFRSVFDIDTFCRELPLRIGFLMANLEDSLTDDTISLLKNSGKPIPPSAYVYAKQFLKAKEKSKIL